MPIRINLLAESQAAEEARRRNPVKLGIWVGGFLVVAMLIWIGKIYMDIQIEAKSYGQLKKLLADQKPQSDAATNYQARMDVVNSKLDALDRLSTNRFLWGPVLDAFQKTVVDNIVVTHIIGSQFYAKEDSHMVGATPVPGAVTEKITLTVSGRDHNPAAEGYSNYKETLSHYNYFTNHLGVTNGWTLNGELGPKVVNPRDPGRQFQDFSLKASFPDIRRND